MRGTSVYRPLIMATVLALCQIASGATAAQFLQAATPPAFRTGNTLPPLTRWGWVMPTDLRIELAAHWGYALELGEANAWLVSDLANPNSDSSKLVAMSRANPKQYPLFVLAYTPLRDPAVLNTFPSSTWCSAADGTKVWSPEASNAVFQQAATLAVQPLQKLLAKAPVSIILNGGEYALSVPTPQNQTTWGNDPKVAKAKGTKSWVDYVSQAKVRQESIISAAFRNVCPKRTLYVYFHDDGCARGGQGGWQNYCWQYSCMRPVSDIASGFSYYMCDNTGFTGNTDMLSGVLDGVAQQIAAGAPLSYNWVNGGWEGNPWNPGEANDLCDLDLYEGFLKCWYTAGMTGGVAGYFSYPAGGFNGDLGPVAPHWLQQIMVLGRVHGLFTNLENFLRQGDLLPGPQKHSWNPSVPAYEFPTGDPTARVVARKLRSSSTWLVTAWAASGNDRQVTVTVPTLGKFTTLACRNGAVYQATLQGGKPMVARVDTIVPTKAQIAAAAAAANKAMKKAPLRK